MLAATLFVVVLDEGGRSDLLFSFFCDEVGELITDKSLNLRLFSPLTSGGWDPLGQLPSCSEGNVVDLHSSLVVEPLLEYCSSHRAAVTLLL